MDERASRETEVGQWNLSGPKSYVLRLNVVKRESGIVQRALYIGVAEGRDIWRLFSNYKMTTSSKNVHIDPKFN